MKVAKKTLLVFGVYLLVPVFLFFWLNLQVIHKYEVKDGIWLVETNDKLTEEQKAEEFKEIDQLEKDIEKYSLLMLVLAGASFITATALILKSGKTE